jgi:hypothetical protein
MAHPKQPPPVQFRPGPLLGRWLSDLASAWTINENDVARRLAALTVSELKLDQYDLLVQLAGAIAPAGSRTGADFVLACDHVRTAIDSANRARRDLNQEPLDHAEVRSFVKRLVQDTVRRKRSREILPREQTIQVCRTQ